MRGFTALEIIVVLAIVAVMMALALPNSAMLTDKTKFEISKETLRDTLQMARNWSRTRQECVSVKVSGLQIVVVGYILAPGAATTSCPSPLVGTVDPSTSTVKALPVGTTVTPFQKKLGGTIPFVVFNQTGATDYNDTILTTLALGSNSVVFQVNPITGLISP